MHRAETRSLVKSEIASVKTKSEEHEGDRNGRQARVEKRKEGKGGTEKEWRMVDTQERRKEKEGNIDTEKR